MVTPRQPLEATMAQELSGERKRAPEKWRIEVHLLSTLKKKKIHIPNDHSEGPNGISHGSCEVCIK